MTASKPPSAPGDAQRVIGITLVAVAGVGAMIGTVSAVGAANAVAEYNRGCDEDRCHSELDREIETKRTTAVIAFTLSACAALVGVSLWLTAPSSQKTPQARVTWTPRGPGDRPGVTLRARF